MAAILPSLLPAGRESHRLVKPPFHAKFAQKSWLFGCEALWHNASQKERICKPVQKKQWDFHKLQLEKGPYMDLGVGEAKLCVFAPCGSVDHPCREWQTELVDYSSEFFMVF